MRRNRRVMGRRPQPGRGGWATSRGRLIYNLALSLFAAVSGFIFVFAPGVFGATEDARWVGGALAGYGVFRAYYTYQRLRAYPRNPQQGPGNR